MTIQYVKEYFLDKKLIPCPLTEELVIAGYQQVSGGYIDRAKKSGIKVNYKDNAPSQYWHLMSYCYSRDRSKPFNKRIVCGELIFWMAEASRAVDFVTLRQLANRIIGSADNIKGCRPIYDRKKWNLEIQRVCFDKIVSAIKIDEAFKIALKLAVDKGWRENDLEYMWYDGEKYLFRLFHPFDGDFGSPSGISVKDGTATIVELA